MIQEVRTYSLRTGEQTHVKRLTPATHRALSLFNRAVNSPLFWSLSSAAIGTVSLIACGVSSPRVTKCALGALMALWAMQSPQTKKKLIYEASLAFSLIWGSQYTKVTNQLILGRQPLKNYDDLKKLKKEGVGAVLSMVEPFEMEPSLIGVPLTKKELEQEGIVYYNLASVDFASVSVDTLDRAALFIREQIARGTTIYVHCKAGLGRGAAAVIAYLILSNKMKVEDAIACVSEKRHIIVRHSLRTLGEFAVKWNLKKPC